MQRLKTFFTLMALTVGINAQSHANGIFNSDLSNSAWPEGGSITIKNCLDIELTVNVLWDNFSISRHTFSVTPKSDYIWDGKRDDQKLVQSAGPFIMEITTHKDAINMSLPKRSGQLLPAEHACIAVYAISNAQTSGQIKTPLPCDDPIVQSKCGLTPPDPINPEPVEPLADPTETPSDETPTTSPENIQPNDSEGATLNELAALLVDLS